MTLVARCPACGTNFRVQPAQLAAKGGKVRCGKCAAVFDGVSALVDGDAPGAAPREEGSAAAVTGSQDTPEFLRETPTARLGLVWGFFALLALLALLGQVVLRHRTDLATQWPAVRPPLAAACAWLGCELRLPRRPELLSIESSDIQPDPARDHVIVLNAVVRNRAPFAQEYPALELTLTDERDYAVLRRVIQPAEYLRQAGAAGTAQGLAGGAELVLRVHLENTGRPAVGYRLYLFYP